MADYVIINVDGSLTEGDGYPREVGCHEVYGQNLRPVYRSGSMWRLLRCDRSLEMPDAHPLNPVARLVLTGLHRSIEPEPIRGAAALLLIGADNEHLPIPPKRLAQLRVLANTARSIALRLADFPSSVDRPRLTGGSGPQ